MSNIEKIPGNQDTITIKEILAYIEECSCDDIDYGRKPLNFDDD